jgi:hypothetical protein
VNILYSQLNIKYSVFINLWFIKDAISSLASKSSGISKSWIGKMYMEAALAYFQLLA